MLQILEMMTWIQHGDVVIDQLEGVTVAGKHQRTVSGLVSHGRQGANHVVALIAGLFDIGDS